MEGYDPDMDMFMMCEELNRAALSAMPCGYLTRRMREGELGVWKRMPFDGGGTAEQLAYMDEFRECVYRPKGALFREICLFAVNGDDEPVGTCLAWRLYDRHTALHWFKTVKRLEGNGIGRALLSAVMGRLRPEGYPVYLHTQAGSYRAVKLYSDFGFALLKDEAVGHRRNELERCLPVLKRLMPPKGFAGLGFGYSHTDILEDLAAHDTNDF